MHNFLQLFAEGEAAGVTSADAGQDTGVTSAAAEQTQADQLTQLGVPENRIRAKFRETKIPSAQQPAQQPVQQVEEKPEEPQAAAARMTWDEIKADPEYNKEIQKIVSARTQKSKAATDGMAALQPALEILEKKYGIQNGDLSALSNAIVNDDAYYEDKALEMGVSTDVVKQLENAERIAQQAEIERRQFINEQKFNEHIAKLNQQAIELQKKYPDFDLRRELENPAFRQLTAPEMLSVEDAYELIHRDEIKQRIRDAALQESKQQLANAVQSNRSRPNEGGRTSANINNFDYRHASKEQRDALKARIMSGEIIYPDQL